MDKVKLNSLLIPPYATLKQAMQKLNETAEKIVFVTDNGSVLIGTITDGDIRRGIIDNLGFSEPVKNVMFKDFIALRSNTAKIGQRAKELMVKNKVEQIPIVDDNGAITDVILWTDVLDDGRLPKLKQKFYVNTVVIMAGGKGSRLDPFTRILPKPLIPIGDKPIIEIIMENFYRYGFHKFIYTLNYKKEYLKLFLKENKFPYSIELVEEADYLGTVGSLSLLKEKIKDTFFVMNCDSLLDVDFRQVLKWHKEQKAAMTIVGCHTEVKIPFGVLELGKGRLKKIFEKPVHDVIVNTGAYVMEPEVISYLPRDKRIDMNTLIDLIAKKRKVVVYPIYKSWIDLGQWEEYKKNLKILEDI